MIKSLAVALTWILHHLSDINKICLAFISHSLKEAESFFKKILYSKRNADAV